MIYTDVNELDKLRYLLVGKTITAVNHPGKEEAAIATIVTSTGEFTICGNDLGWWIESEKVKNTKSKHFITSDIPKMFWNMADYYNCIFEIAIDKANDEVSFKCISDDVSKNKEWFVYLPSFLESKYGVFLKNDKSMTTLEKLLGANIIPGLFGFDDINEYVKDSYNFEKEYYGCQIEFDEVGE